MLSSETGFTRTNPPIAFTYVKVRLILREQPARWASSSWSVVRLVDRDGVRYQAVIVSVIDDLRVSEN